MEIVDVIIIGGGQAGLSISYYLCEQGLSHIVFEKGSIGESWRSQRWSSFVLNTPNSINILPGPYGSLSDPDKFLTANEYCEFLIQYADKNSLPVNLNSEVISIERDSEENTFIAAVRHEDHVQHYTARQVVVASGALSTYKLPEISKAIPKSIFQLHASQYKNSSQLPEGSVLVVGGAQSGCQVAEDLAEAGRTVFLSSSRVMRFPRRYKGRDITSWLAAMKFFDVPTDSVTDEQMLRTPKPQLSGKGKQGHTVSYQYLKSRGVRIFGHLSNISNYEFIFAPDAKANVRFADESSQMVKSLVDQFIAKSGIRDLSDEEDTADNPDADCICGEDIFSMHSVHNNISSVIWCTGFMGDFSCLKVPVLNTHGVPIHRNGISPVKGLYFLGFPWLRARKSGMIYGTGDDALAISNEILAQVNQPA